MSMRSPAPVFLSVARTSLEYPRALRDALRRKQIEAFLYERDIPPGAEFPGEIAEALLGARVVVIFAGDDYFSRGWCIREYAAALAPFTILAAGPNQEDEARRRALEHVVVALPAGGATDAILSHLPAPLRARNWPSADTTDVLAKLVQSCLQTASAALDTRLRQLGHGHADRVRNELLRGAAMPPPALPGQTPRHAPRLRPSLGERFFGREHELWQIHHKLHTLRAGDPQAAAPILALEGLGGVGKTQLAAEYFHRFGPRHYQGGCFWLSAADSLEEQFHGVLKAIKPDAPGLEVFRANFKESLSEALRSQLAEAFAKVEADKPVLYVVDNVPELEQASPKGPEHWCPAPGQVALLLTSRMRLGLDPTVQGIQIHPLSPDAAADLLGHDLHQLNVAKDEWKKIAAWVGYLPLALALLNAALKAGALGVDRLLKLVRGGGEITAELDRQMEALRGQVPEGALRGVTEAFRASYDSLSEAGSRLARLIALLAPEAVPDTLVEALIDKAGINGPKARAELRLRSFVTAVESADVAMYGQMHRVLADFIRSRDADWEAETISVCQALLDVMPEDPERQRPKWAEANACLPHAARVVQRMANEVAVDKAKASLETAAASAARVAGRAHLLLHAQGRYREAVQFGKDCLELTARILGEEHPDTLATMHNLALVLRGQGEHAQARALYEKVLEAWRRILGEEHPDTLATMHNLALVLRDQGELAQARALCEKVLEARRHILGEEHPDTLATTRNLAGVLRDQGELAQARALWEKVLEAQRRILGEEHPDTLATMHNLAVVLRDQGDIGAARQLLNEACQLARRVLGNADPRAGELAALEEMAAKLRDGELVGERTQYVIGILRRRAHGKP